MGSLVVYCFFSFFKIDKNVEMMNIVYFSSI